ncbi:ATP-binding cassette domain-containing protein [Cryptosporangium sp. NPDC051539]|uniref:branched-chain amino acid ABC transporter ATP-binding protein/permease n=1 Tax=Cryptosporangium sp. NPDC051539 TaxID=3363962 RepID=UPI0037BD9E9E
MRFRSPVLLVLALVAILGVARGSYYWQNVALTAAVFCILAVSLDLAAGVTGLYSLGHAGLFALGAYTTTLLNSHFGTNVFLLLPLVIVGVGLVGILLGSLSLRVSGLYFAITTFIFTLVVGVLLSDLDFTGGLQGLPGPTFPDFPLSLSGLGSSVAWAAGLALLATVAIVWSIRSSPMYPVLLAIRDAEPFAAAAGVRTSVVKVLVFGLSSALAGVAGWVFSFLGFVSPGQFTWNVSVNILVMVILGGINTRIGPLLGAVFVSAFPVVVAIDPFQQEALFGLVFLLVIVFLPQGVVGLSGQLARRFRPPVAVPDVTPAVLGPREIPASDEPALAVRGVTFSYTKGVRALDDVDMTVRRGTIHGLIGPNGSGKSTLVNLISGQLRPDAGTISAVGERIDDRPAAARAGRGLSRTFQTPVLVRELAARQNVGIGTYSTTPRLLGRAPLWPVLPGSRRTDRRIHEQADQALGELGLAPRWGVARVADAPHGIEMLTQFAAATVARPSVLLLDEPLAGLSAGEVEHVAGILDRLRDAGVTVIVVEHQTKFIFRLCDEVTVLAAGQLITTGSAAEVRNDSRVREVYLGQ